MDRHVCAHRIELIGDFPPSFSPSTCKITWAPGPCLKRARGGLVSIDKKAIEVKRMSASCSLYQTWPPHPTTVRSEADSAQDVPTRDRSEVGRDLSSTPAEQPDTRGPEPRSEDTVPASPDVGRLQVADAEAWEWVSVRATRGFAALQGKHSVEMEVTPVGTRRRRAVGNTKSGGSEDRNTLRCFEPRSSSPWLWLYGDRSIIFLHVAYPAVISVFSALLRHSLRMNHFRAIVGFQGIYLVVITPWAIQGASRPKHNVV